MKAKIFPPTRDRRDIGEVVSPIEKMMAARDSSSCCVGVEALLEIDSQYLAMNATRRRAAAEKHRKR